MDGMRDSPLGMASWKKTITSPFRKACTFFNQQPQREHRSPTIITFNTTKKEDMMMDLQGEVMACRYEDVHVMWSMLD
ncbi:hypothetical protein SAY87_025230 [Trapa incisa]|uniref:Uncharacterized protein n=1 Tax=Trapa incisa TaxID=236973 RepID=A0AAN7GSC9_9MYRT|nr:hypothetical protein SAY87_025230 [Trapa incisa]